MLSAQPKRLADEIAQKLVYTKSANVDEFTLMGWKQQLEDLRGERSLESDEFRVLARVYHGLKQYSRFIEVCEAGLSKHEDLSILEEQTIGSLMLAHQGEIADSPRTVLKRWFDSALNAERRSIAFNSHPGSILYWDLSLHFAVRPTVRVTIDKRLAFHVSTGPLSVVEYFPYIESVDFCFIAPLLDLYCNNVISVAEGVTDQTGHLRNVLDKTSFDLLEKYIEEELSDSAEDDEEDIADADAAVMAYKESAGEGFVRVAEARERPR